MVKSEKAEIRIIVICVLLHMISSLDERVIAVGVWQIGTIQQGHEVICAGTEFIVSKISPFAFKYSLTGLSDWIIL